MSEKLTEPGDGKSSIDYEALMPQKPEQAEAPPTLSENLALLESELERMEAEIPDYAGTGNPPKWWIEEGVSINHLQKQLKAPDADPESISRYFVLNSKRRQLSSQITGRDSIGNDLSVFCMVMGEDVAARGFSAETVEGPMHMAMMQRLTDAEKNGDLIIPEMKTLASAYGLDRVSDLLGLAGEGYEADVRAKLRNANAVKWMRTDEQVRMKPDDTMDQVRENYRKWMRETLSRVEGIEESEADDYIWAASRKGEDQTILDILDRFDEFGVDRLRAIRDFTGIHAFQDYSSEQLTRMESLQQHPKQESELLAGHDVNVLMVNRFGDHNDIMANSAANFDDENGRTLFFEITHMSDIYRHMVTLHNMGIEPSTLVLSAHSAPGQFMVTDDRDPAQKHRDVATIAGRRLVKSVNAQPDVADGDYDFSLRNMAGFARMVGSWMQASLGIDDDKDDIGRKKILFQACHAGSETEAGDKDEAGAKLSLGMDSVISRLGNDLVDSGSSSSVDIYGAPGGIQLHKTDRGVRYSGQPASFGESRVPLHAVRVRVEQGQLSKSNVDEVILHKAA